MNPSRQAKTALVAAFMATLCASAAGAQDDPPRIVSMPSEQDFARYYPDRAQRLEISGRAGIACEADIDGRLQQCAITEEWPTGFAFGAAALHLAPLIHVTHAGPFRTMINFRLPHDSTPQALIVAARDDAHRTTPIHIQSAPSDAERSAAYPGRGGKVLMERLKCRLTAAGQLSDCEAAGSDVDPEGLEAAIRLAGEYQLDRPAPPFIDGEASVFMHLVPPDPGVRGGTR